jgi:hypothetical protein
VIRLLDSTAVQVVLLILFAMIGLMFLGAMIPAEKP